MNIHFFGRARRLCTVVVLLLAGGERLAAQSDAVIPPTQDTFPLRVHLQLDVPGATHIELDRFGNIYTATDGNRISRYDSSGIKSIFEYSNNRMGIPQNIDATNPLNILLYYPDFQTIIYLSRTLSQEGALQLSNLGYVQVPVISTAADGNIWLMDMLDFKLKKITPEGKLIRESQELNLLAMQLTQPFQILDTGEYIYVADKVSGIIQLDGFGQFIKQIEANAVQSIGSKGEYLVYKQGNELVFLHSKLSHERRFTVPSTLQIHRNGSCFELLDAGKILIYAY